MAANGLPPAVLTLILFLIILSWSRKVCNVHGYLISQRLCNAKNNQYEHRYWSRQCSFIAKTRRQHCYSMTTNSINDDEKDNVNDDDYDDDDDDDDDAINIEPYGSRSLAWTKRYRKLIPYEKARRTAMSFGLSSKEEWEELIQDGKGIRGPYVISRPDEMYRNEWEGWDEFLGTMRSYEEARHIVQVVLRIQSMKDYESFIQNDKQRAEGLRIPARPDIVYKDQWEPVDFFGPINQKREDGIDE